MKNLDDYIKDVETVIDSIKILSDKNDNNEYFISMVMCCVVGYQHQHKTPIIFNTVDLSKVKEKILKHPDRYSMSYTNGEVAVYYKEDSGELTLVTDISSEITSVKDI